MDLYLSLRMNSFFLFYIQASTVNNINIHNTSFILEHRRSRLELLDSIWILWKVLIIYIMYSDQDKHT